MRELVGQFLRRRLAADLVHHLARGAHDLVDRLDHVDGNADGARLVGDRAGDRLPDPPGGIGRKLVAAAVFELVDRLHQADVAFLDQIEELQAAVGVFLGNRDDEPEVGFHHLLLGDAGLALALLHHRHDAAELGDLQAGQRGQFEDLVADDADRFLLVVDKFLPAMLGKARDPLQPVGIELVALVFLEKHLARHPVGFGEPHAGRPSSELSLRLMS